MTVMSVITTVVFVSAVLLGMLLTGILLHIFQSHILVKAASAMEPLLLSLSLPVHNRITGSRVRNLLGWLAGLFALVVTTLAPIVLASVIAYWEYGYFSSKPTPNRWMEFLLAVGLGQIIMTIAWCLDGAGAACGFGRAVTWSTFIVLRGFFRRGRVSPS